MIVKVLVTVIGITIGTAAPASAGSHKLSPPRTQVANGERQAEIEEIGRLAHEASEMQRRRYRVKDDDGETDIGANRSVEPDAGPNSGDSGAGSNLTDF